jgi:hypothetical protein
MRWLALSAAAAAVVLAAVANVPGARRLATASVYFRGHGGSVVCGVFTGSGVPALLECGTLAQLKPSPSRPSGRTCGGLDFAGNRIRLGVTGGPYGFCSGDVGVLARIDNAPKLAYGTAKHVGPFACTSTAAWLTCRNGSGRGFALSRNRWHAVS